MSATCPACQATFEPKRPWQRFDKPSCRRAYHKSGGATELTQKVADLERRVRELEEQMGMVRGHLVI